MAGAKKWQARTREDELGRAAPADLDAVPEMEKCDSCRRTVPTFELLIVEAVDEIPGRAACSGCVSVPFYQGRLTRSALAEKLGAPGHEVQRLRGVEHARAAREAERARSDYYLSSP